MVKRAVVVGAGIGGLATAVALQDRGWTVVVLERASGIDEGGTALGMWPEAMRALDELDIGAGVRAHSVASHGARILDPRGEVIGRIPEHRQAYLVSRARLLNALHGALPAGTVQWDASISSPDDVPDAELVVGADGIHSAVRSRFLGVAGERALRTTAYRGVLEGEVGSVSETWGEGRLFGITPSSDGTINWFACLRSDLRPAAPYDAAGFLRDQFSTWHPAVAHIVARLEDGMIDRRSLFDVSFSGPYVSARVALVGDAAHAMAPNLGRGACESLIDAVTLARALERTDDVGAALQDYDRLRRRRTQRIVRAARALNRLSTARRLPRLRRATVRLLSSAMNATSSHDVTRGAAA